MVDVFGTCTSGWKRRVDGETAVYGDMAVSISVRGDDVVVRRSPPFVLIGQIDQRSPPFLLFLAPNVPVDNRCIVDLLLARRARDAREAAPGRVGGFDHGQRV